ncbi:VapE domain-containing protein, partial [Parabacteroides distasonis]
TAVRTAVIFAREAGLTCGEGDIDRIVRSQLVRVWNPVDDFLGGLPRWDGRDRLGEMAARVPDGTGMMRKYFPVWMRMTVNFWRQRNPMFGATMMLMLVGRQGMKKSTFFRLLLPPELRNYYHDRVDFMTKRDAELYATRFCLVNLDEYDQHSASQVAFLKHLLQETDVKNRGV